MLSSVVPGKAKPQNSDDVVTSMYHYMDMMKESRRKRAALKHGEDPNSPEILRPIELWKEQQRKILGSTEVIKYVTETKQVINFAYATNEDPECPEIQREMREYCIEREKGTRRKRVEERRDRRKKNENRRMSKNKLIISNH